MVEVSQYTRGGGKAFNRGVRREKAAENAEKSKGKRIRKNQENKEKQEKRHRGGGEGQKLERLQDAATGNEPEICSAFFAGFLGELCG